MFGNLIIQASLAAGTQVRISTYIEDLSAGLGNRFSADLKFIPRQDTDSTTSTAADQPAASSLAELYAHSCVVCAQSDYFSELFRKTTDEWDKLRDDMTLSDMVGGVTDRKCDRSALSPYSVIMFVFVAVLGI